MIHNALVISLEHKRRTITINAFTEVLCDLFTDRIASRQGQELISRTQILHIAEIDFTSEAHVVLCAVHRSYDSGRYPLDPAKMPSMIGQKILPDLFHHSCQLPPGQLKVVSSVQLGGSRTPFPSMI
jgi:hypothetical protein